MELRQLRYFARVVEAGSITKAAADLGIAQSALSHQISKLESELSVRLLQRMTKGIVPTAAGMAFFREAQLVLRHAEQAVRSAQDSRLTGSVTIGLAPTTMSMLGLSLINEMHRRYPDVRLHLVESLSGHLTNMLNIRQIDLAILFNINAARHWTITPLVEEKVFYIQSRAVRNAISDLQAIDITDLQDIPLILPTSMHGLRSTIDQFMTRSNTTPRLQLEIDSLAMLMEAVVNGIGGTLQPAAALGRFPDGSSLFHLAELKDAHALRLNYLCSLPEEELSPAALATRIVIRDCVHQLVTSGRWKGTRLYAQ